jgi:hypothetical protein
MMVTVICTGYVGLVCRVCLDVDPGKVDRPRTALRQPVIFDGRNMYAPEAPGSEGIEYHTIGRMTSVARSAYAARAGAAQ